MRILYVALTRAKEKLIITGIQKDYEKRKEKLLQQIARYQREENKINPILVKQYKKYLDWILLVYFYEKDAITPIVWLKNYTKKEILSFTKEKQTEEIDVLAELDRYEKNKEKIRALEKQLHSKYPYELATKIPTKSSVSQLKQEVKEDITINFRTPKFIRKRRSYFNRSRKRNYITLMFAKIR